MRHRPQAQPQRRLAPFVIGGEVWNSERAKFLERLCLGDALSQRRLDLGEEPRRLRTFLARLGRAEFLEQFALLRGQLGRHLDVDAHHQVAATAPLQHRHARAAVADLAARLDGRADLDRDALAIEPGDRDLPPPRPCSTGMPAPRWRISRPDWMPAPILIGMRSPSSPGIAISPPSAAVVKLI